MNSQLKNNKYIYYILIHAVLGLVVSSFLIVSKILSVFIVVFGVLYIIKTKDKNNEALFLAAYVCGVEIFLRMTGGAFFHEYGKYTISLFCLIGMFYHPIKLDKLIFIFLLLLLLPGIYLGLIESSHVVALRKTIMFNISGEFCLLACCFYTINCKVTFEKLLNIVYTISLPAVSIVIYISTYTISTSNIYTSTGSNFSATAGFGPNQVATILGLATFCFLALLLLKRNTKVENILYIILLLLCAYRGVVTFSRGGMITALVMVLSLIVIIYYYANKSARLKILMFSLAAFLSFLAFWAYTSYVTDGLIVKRYNNQDAIGREKTSALSGREMLMETEWQMFIENPILGVGVGRNKELRMEELGFEIASHNEITRLLAEHGTFGIIYFSILVIFPLAIWYNNRQHLLLIPFFLFWGLTLNHAAMRTASPAFIYSLCLLNVRMNFEKTPTNENRLHRKSIS